VTQPRLLADYAAVPTPRERRHARTENRAAQLELVPIEHEHQADPCAVCASTEHTTERCPHGTAPALDLDDGPRVEHIDRFGRIVPDPYAVPITPATEPEPTMHTSTSAQRDENRLTDDDLERMAAAVTTFARQTPTMGTGERYTTAERIAHRAIGCDERDLRDSELLAIRQMFKPILAAHSAGTLKR
jgi:hypothetical protein